MAGCAAAVAAVVFVHALVRAPEKALVQQLGAGHSRA